MSITKLGPTAAVILAAALLGRPAAAQQPPAQPLPQTPKIALTTLTGQGYEIKAAITSNAQYQLLYLQKGKDAYACIVAHLADAQPWKSDCYPME